MILSTYEFDFHAAHSSSLDLIVYSGAIDLRMYSAIVIRRSRFESPWTTAISSCDHFPPEFYD